MRRTPATRDRVRRVAEGLGRQPSATSSLRTSPPCAPVASKSACTTRTWTGRTPTTPPCAPTDRTRPSAATATQFVRILVETVGGGGNLLLDVGPKEDGTLLPEQTERLEALGEWTSRHAAAVHGTVRGLPHGHFYGPSALSADRRTLYLFLFDRPNEYVVLRGVRNGVTSARVLGEDTAVRHERVGGLGDVPGWEYVHLTDDVLDPLCTVIALELDGELDLYRAHTRD
jgi:hypothetical protein